MAQTQLHFILFLRIQLFTEQLTEEAESKRPKRESSSGLSWLPLSSPELGQQWWREQDLPWGAAPAAGGCPGAPPCT